MICSFWPLRCFELIFLVVSSLLRSLKTYYPDNEQRTAKENTDNTLNDSERHSDVFVLIGKTPGHVTLLDDFRPMSSYRNQTTISFYSLFHINILACQKKSRYSMSYIFIPQQELLLRKNQTNFEQILSVSLKRYG